MKLFYLIFFLIPANLVLAQNIDVTGRIVDSTRMGLPSASIVLLNKIDSVMQSFAITNAKGEFNMGRVKPGEYILQVSYVGYQNISRLQKVSEENRNLGDIVLTENSKILDGVSVTADRIPILINGDTVEYNSAAYKTKPNATVEELLKKLPGVEVDQDGNIKAHGEDVNKVLVDGKEFFGDDPKIATKNLPADVVNKVQVFDKMSEMSEFTGVDDGERNKTINLDLKDDKKKGYFGKITGGYGSDDRYSAKANVNRFTKKMQLSALAASNNTNEQNFSFQDYMNFAGGLGNMMSSNGGSGLTISNDFAGGAPQQQGINTTYSGGLNFNYDFNKSTEISLNYFYNGVNNRLIRESSKINFLGDENFNSGDTTNRRSENYNHKANLKLKRTIRKGEDLTLRANLGFNNSNANSVNSSETFDPADDLQNSRNTINTSDGSGHNINGSLLYRKRFKKEGRSFTTQLNLASNSGEQLSFLNSVNRFFLDDSTLDEVLNQRQEDKNDAFNYQGSVNYTEPLGKSKFLQLNYSVQNFNDNQERNFFDIQNDGTLEPNLDLSNSFDRDFIYHRPGLNLLITKSKSTLNIGVKSQNSRLSGNVINSSDKIERSFDNILPSLQWKYKFSSSNRVAFNYSTSIREPSLRQLQPIVDNSNPFVIYTGNPNLRPEYAHSGRLNYTLFDSFSFTSLFLTLTGSITENKITNATRINDLLVQEINPINIGEEYQAVGYMSFSTPLKFIGAKVNVSANMIYTQSQLFINDQKNTVDRSINSIDLSLENRKKNVVDLTIGGKLEFNNTAYSNDSELDQNFVNKTIYTDLNISFLKTWNFNSSLDYRIFEGDAFNEDLEIPLWKAEVSNSFGKLRRLTAKLSVFDILDRNRGINRNSAFNFIQEQRVNALGLYAMFSLTYSLSAFGNNHGGIVIKTGR